MNYERIQSILKSSRNTVCLLGVESSMDSGCFYYHDADGAMDVESEYGYSPEEMFSTIFYNTRTKEFFDFYRDKLLGHMGTPGADLKVLRQMEQDGKLNGIITREVFGLAKRAGCENVIELHGTVLKNRCPHCGKEYTMEYIKNHSGVPQCEVCHATIRPQVCLVGEMLDNATVTRAADLVSQAEVLLVLGCTLKSSLAGQFLKYFNGEQLILIHENEHYTDEKADIICYGKPRDVLPKIYQ